MPKNKIICVDCYKAMSDETRIVLIRNLREGYINVAAMTKILGVTQPTVSHHLKILMDYGYITKKKLGRESYYKFNADATCSGCRVFNPPKK